jgi:hypothetical protein
MSDKQGWHSGHPGQIDLLDPGATPEGSLGMECRARSAQTSNPTAVRRIVETHVAGMVPLL